MSVGIHGGAPHAQATHGAQAGHGPAAPPPASGGGAPPASNSLGHAAKIDYHAAPPSGAEGAHHHK